MNEPLSFEAASRPQRDRLDRRTVAIRGAGQDKLIQFPAFQPGVELQRRSTGERDKLWDTLAPARARDSFGCR